MIGITNKKLDIFERFDTDNALPKHAQKPVQKEGQRFVLTPDTAINDYDLIASDGSNQFTWTPKITQGQISQYQISHQISIFERIKRFFKRKPKEQPQLPPAETYTVIFHNTEQLKAFAAKQEAFEKLVQNARQNGQTALVEELASKHRITAYEDALVILGYTRFITEEMLVELATRSDKAFCLNWIKNFTRIIPDHAAERKRELDKARIFDNYVILHYDPDGKGNKLTHAETQAKRDPILFGVIRGSRRLYLVADWVDTTCNLTFEELVKHFEQNKVQGTTTIA